MHNVTPQGTTESEVIFREASGTKISSISDNEDMFLSKNEKERENVKRVAKIDDRLDM